MLLKQAERARAIREGKRKTRESASQGERVARKPYVVGQFQQPQVRTVPECRGDIAAHARAFEPKNAKLR